MIGYDKHVGSTLRDDSCRPDEHDTVSVMVRDNNVGSKLRDGPCRPGEHDTDAVIVRDKTRGAGIP